jgi:hypothetical protein
MVKRYMLSKKYEWFGMPMTLRLVEERKGKFCVRAILIVNHHYPGRIREICLSHTENELEAILEFKRLSENISRAIKIDGNSSYPWLSVEDKEGMLEVFRAEEFAF